VAYVQIKPDGPIYPFVFTFKNGTNRLEAQTLAKEARAWCLEQFGFTPRFKMRPVDGTPAQRPAWRVTSTRAKFMSEDAAMAFKMRWC
jgi:hypothetical protein